jgi:hypothetical protein
MDEWVPVAYSRPETKLDRLLRIIRRAGSALLGGWLRFAKAVGIV